MTDHVRRWASAVPSGELAFALSTAVPLTVLYVTVVALSGGAATALAWFPLAAVLLFMAANLEVALVVVVVSLFVNVYVWGFNSAVWSALPLGAAFIIRQKDIAWKDLSHPLTVPILVYGACIVPSFFNAWQPLACLGSLLNVVSFLVALHVTFVTLRSHQDLRRLAGLYLGMSLLNSAHVFVLYLSGVSRPFGFAGLMFVDLSAFAVCLSVTMSIVSRGWQRIGLLALSLILTAALILTQTRNTWLSAAITLALLAVYLVFHPEAAGITRSRMISMTVVGSALIAGIAALMILLNPNIEERATELTRTPALSVDESGHIENSLGTRIMIWGTALNAFLEHPVAGIGVYSFPYASRQYYTIPRSLYEELVEGRTPHQTHLAVLTETGVVGFAGFLVFIVSALRTAFGAIGKAKAEQGKRYSLVGAVAVLYCVVSMTFTDAWLWGQLIVMLGVVMGAMLANRRIAAGPEPGMPDPAR